MSKSWQFLIIFAVIILGMYSGFEIYNSIVGENVEFKGQVTPISTDLGQDVLDHINFSIQELEYKGEESDTGQ